MVRMGSQKGDGTKKEAGAGLGQVNSKLGKKSSKESLKFSLAKC